MLIGFVFRSDCRELMVLQGPLSLWRDEGTHCPARKVVEVVNRSSPGDVGSQGKKRNAGQSLPAKQRGVSFLEFALIAPILLGLVFAVLNMNDAFEHLHRIAKAHFETGRALSIAPPGQATECRNQVQLRLEDSLRDLPRIKELSVGVETSTKAGVAFVDLRVQARVSCLLCGIAGVMGSGAFSYNRIMGYPLEGGEGCGSGQ